MVTLYHWDTPLALDEAGGWMNRDTAYRLAEFAAIAAAAYGDRVARWCTINEPATVTTNGYTLGLHSPGEALMLNALPTVHHQLLGHGLALQALRAAEVPGEIGMTNVYSPMVPNSINPLDKISAGPDGHGPEPALRGPGPDRQVPGPHPGREVLQLLRPSGRGHGHHLPAAGFLRPELLHAHARWRWARAKARCRRAWRRPWAAT